MEFDTSMRINPFARLLFFFLTGILAASGSGLNSLTEIYLSVSLLTGLIIVFLYTSRRPVFNTGKISGIFMSAIFIIAGIISYSNYNLHCERLRQSSGFSGIMGLQIDEPVSETPKMIRCIAHVERVDHQHPVYRQKQKILVYFEKDPASVQLVPGDRLICHTNLQEIPSPLNPQQFDYRHYLATKRIINQAFIRSGSWTTAEKKAFSFKAASYRMQHALLEKYRKIGLNQTLFSILSAVTLGYKNELDLQTRQAFSKAGVMHVMALSGFNVAIIAFALNYLLFFLNRFYYGKHIRVILIIAFIWLFAFITGFSSSVTRASLMISLVLAGKEFNRHLHVTNILYASAFILLTLSPALIYDISFQLSFAAVFGIIVFHPTIEKVIDIRNRYLLAVWKVFTVSLAAQLATMPLTIAYFHQFPVYFWITNLYVVPLVSVIICAAGVFLMVSPFEPLMIFTGKILGLLTGLLYKSISWIEVMPYAVINDIRISTVQLIMMIFLLIITGLYIHFRKGFILISALILVIFIQISGILSMNRIRHQQLFMVGSTKSSTFINLIDGRYSLVLGNSSQNNNYIKYSFGNFWTHHGIRAENVKYHSIPDTNIIFTFSGQTILILNSTNPPVVNVPADILIITGKARLNKDIIAQTNPLLVIIDSSVNLYKANKWALTCSELDIPCRNVNQEGAYVFEKRKRFRVPHDRYLAGQ